LQKAMQNRIELSIEKVYKDWIPILLIKLEQKEGIKKRRDIKMDKKYGILIICAVILFLCFAGTASAKTWYVDDDLQDFPYADFTKIQNAVNMASPGDIIIVYNGTYPEDIEVDKQLNLWGAPQYRL